MTPRNFTCIAKGHFLLEFVMYLYLSTTDYIHILQATAKLSLLYVHLTRSGPLILIIRHLVKNHYYSIYNAHRYHKPFD